MKKFAYITNTDSSDISVVDLEEQKEIKRIPTGSNPRGGMAIDNKGYYGYVSNCAGVTVSVIDLLNNREVSKISVGIAPRGVALTPDGSLLFVSNSGSSDVSVVDIMKREEISRIPVGENPRALSVSPDGKYVSIPSWGSDSLSIVEVNYDNPVEMSETHRILLGKDATPYHAFSHPDGKHVYTANTHRHSISAISLSDMKVINEISVGHGPRAVIADPKEPYLYVSCEGSNVISVVHSEDQKEIKQIDVGPTPRGMKIDPDTRVLFSTQFERSALAKYMEDGNGLSVVDLNNMKRIGGIKTGLGPCSVSIYDPASYQ
ncbi:MULTISPECIES: YncE family protein [Bacillus]|uniref:YncE family protein n=1 Tax=Bacillus TaxID=1386 RepID=UPI000BFD0280|nr:MULTISPECIES: YncE family protein [Bacillus]MCR6850046.1 YncE family protein [Bacillus sp. IBL03825]PGK38678.1 hypothetical protein CN908_17075 [Bacillus thuringiensis]